MVAPMPVVVNCRRNGKLALSGVNRFDRMYSRHQVAHAEVAHDGGRHGDERPTRERPEERAEGDGENGEGDRHHVALVEVEPQGVVDEVQRALPPRHRGAEQSHEHRGYERDQRQSCRNPARPVTLWVQTSR